MNNQDGLWAALDLGSNSFHLLLADVDAGRITTIERIKDKVQLLSGFEQGQIQSTAYERGLACLKRFSQRLNGLPEDRILVMGTAALRQASCACQTRRSHISLNMMPLTCKATKYNNYNEQGWVGVCGGSTCSAKL